MSESVERQEIISPDYSHLDKKKGEKKEKISIIFLFIILFINCLYGIIIGIKIKKMSNEIEDKDKKKNIETIGIVFIVTSVLILFSLIMLGLSAKINNQQITLASFSIFLPSILGNLYVTIASLGEKETRVYGGIGIVFYIFIIIFLVFFFRTLYKNYTNNS